jgi:hypothetical protein
MRLATPIATPVPRMPTEGSHAHAALALVIHQVIAKR